MTQYRVNRSSWFYAGKYPRTFQSLFGTTTPDQGMGGAIDKNLFYMMDE